ncbi:MAG TPA: iron ABC transporter permease, partial [Gammaproteobacteria bacterium]|nr:iron ABC transporter permease [Gammaproteobacteria bacterium]
MPGSSSSRRWQVVSITTATILALPVMTVFAYLLVPDREVWRHLVNTVLKDYVVNSLWLLLGVSFGTLSMGIITAWLTSVCEFPGRRVLLWMLLLPMSMPAYIIAYTYTGMLDFSGPVQSGLRAIFDWSATDYWFPDVRSVGGAMSMLALVLYPYVYLLARAAFLEQSVSILDASRTLGYSPWRSFLRVSLPIARPAIIAGLALALMETLADYGTVQYFG